MRFGPTLPHGSAMTISLTRYCGINLRRMKGETGMWLVMVLWYPTSRKSVGYLYGSLPWL